MDFRHRGYNYANLSQGGIWSGRSVGQGMGGSEVLRDLEKRMIKEEILAKEADDLRRYMVEREMRVGQIGGGFPSSSSIMLGHPDNHHRFQPLLLPGPSYEPVDTRTAMAYQEDYGRSIRLQPSELDVVPLQRSPMVKEIITSPPKAAENVFFGMGSSRGSTVSGTKRKPPQPAAVVSTEITPSKKKLNEWSCAICKVTATSELGLQDHLAGKKHKAKVADLDTDRPEKLHESVETDSYEVKKPEGESSTQKFKYWCRMCKIGTWDKKEWNMHKKGIKHLKNQLNRAQKTQGRAGGGRGRGRGRN